MEKRKGKLNKFVYINRDDRVKIRFVGEQVEMFQYFDINYYNNGGSSVISYAQAGATILDGVSGKLSFFREYDDGNIAYNRTKRIVSLVIDRSDEKVKAFACPISAWNQMTEHDKENDFEIRKEGIALQTRYYAESLGLSEVSEAQEETIKATLDSFTFADIFVDGKWEIVNEVIEKAKHRWQMLDIRED